MAHLRMARPAMGGLPPLRRSPRPQAASTAPVIRGCALTPRVPRALPGAGYPGHGRTASLRRQPFRIVDGRMEGGYTGLFELICPSCGDHPYLDYSEVPPRLQWLRGPRTLKGGLAAYEKHLGLALRPDAA